MSANSAPVWLTSLYLKKLLREFFKDESIEVHNFTVGSGSTVGDGYVGQILRINIDYTKQNVKEPLSIIAKSIPFSDLNEELSKTFDIYKIEMKMMETLPLLHEELLARGETERFFPFLYKVDRENKMIFMEDLIPEGYIVPDRSVSVDLHHTLMVMKAIAKMHASSWIFLKNNPDRKKNYMDIFEKSEDAPMTKMLGGLYDHLLQSLPLWPISEEDKQIFHDLSAKIIDLFFDNYERREPDFKSIIHADFSVRNMMFRYKNEKLDAVKLIDFQGCHINSVVLDLHYFLLSSVETKVVLEHLDEILRTYYDTFVGITGKIEGFTADRVRKEFLEKLGYGFVIATTFRPVILSKNVLDIEAFLKRRESKTNAEMLKNPKYISDVVELLPIFKKHGIFQ